MTFSLVVFGISVLLAVSWTVMGLRALPGMRLAQPLLKGQSPLGAQPQDGVAASPRVTVVIAARNEQAAILHTLDTLRAQTYGNLEIIAVDDRSTDDTGALLNHARATWPEQPPLRVVHVQDLPDGWLGKNHALYQGAGQATGEWLLFTDADIEFDPTTIAQVVAFAQREQADHVTIPPTIHNRGLWLSAAVTFFTYNMMIVFRPQAANIDGSRVGIGIGAFNMIRREAYEQIGTHRAFAMDAVDDLTLGQRVKQAGLHQRFVAGHQLLQVTWYENFRGMLRGLEKNALAPFGYSYTRLGLGLMFCLVFYLGPLVGLVWSLVSHALAGFTRAAGAATAFGPAMDINAWLFAYCIVWMTVLYLWLGRLAHFALGWIFTLPVGVCLLVYALARAAWLTAWRGGIDWRGTRYPLSEVRRHRRHNEI